MCAIAGLFNFNGVTLENPEELIGRMTRVMAHRGPDDSGVWVAPDRRVGFGHRRLSILDLSSNGHQPMHGRDRCTITYNGEIYNFRELRAQLGSGFQSQTDTEVVLRAYEVQGESSVATFNGMFAFAIWDERSQSLLLARDRAGIKPLYHTTLGGIFAFASEIRALLQLPWIRAQIDEPALYDFLSFNSLSAPQTMFRGIAKLPPGCLLRVDASGPRPSCAFWKPVQQDLSGLGEADLQTLVRERLTASVSSQMVSDVPVGAFLSGGVDSSALVALMRQTSSAQIKTYSIGFEGAPSYNELDEARKVAERFGTEHFEKLVRPDDIVEFLPKVVEIFDEPLADATSIPIHFISALARANGTTVVLTGDGSDELFCGYRRWLRYVQVYPWYRRFHALPAVVRSGVLRLGRALNGSPALYESLSHSLLGHNYLWAAGGFREAGKKEFLDPAFVARLNGHDSYAAIENLMAGFEKFSSASGSERQIDWLCYQGFLGAVPNVYLYRADHLGMANSIELRVPFLDNNVIESALSIPGRWKVANNEPKNILKRALEPLLPKEVLYRRKMGFCVPLREWIGGHITDYVEAHLAGFCRDTGYFNEPAIRRQLLHARQGHPDFAFSLWNLYFLMAWFKRWMF